MKFAKVLSRSGQSLLAARARGIANTVKQEQEALIADSKRKAQGIINELTNLMDLSINSTTSLSPVSKDFNPNVLWKKFKTRKVNSVTHWWIGKSPLKLTMNGSLMKQSVCRKNSLKYGA